MHSPTAGALRRATAAAWPAVAAARRLRSRGSTQPAARQCRHTSAVLVKAIATPARAPLQRRGGGFQPEGGGDAAWDPPPHAPLGSPAGVLHRGVSDLWQAYLHSLHRHPLFTKAATSFFCVCLGDGIAQCLGSAPFSAARVLRLAAYSATVGAATGHYWHRWLEAHVYPEAATGNRSVAAKMALDQLVLTPVMTAVFFVALKLMEGRPDAIMPFLQEKYLQTLLAGYAVWVPWNYASFKWIPQDLRILAGNLVGIGWGTFVSVSCINNAGGAPMAPPAICPAAAAALEAVPAACPAVMAAVEAATLGPQ